MLAIFIIMIVITIGVSRYAAGRYDDAYRRGSSENAPLANTGSEIARKFLASEGCEGVEIMEHNGVVTNYYDPKRKRLFLRSEIANSTTLIAWAMALHEAAHAPQAAANKGEFSWRQTCIRLTRYGPMFGAIALIAAAFLKVMPAKIAILGMIGWLALLLALNLGTLAMEFNANLRVRRFLERELRSKDRAREKLESLLPGIALREVGDLLRSPRYFFFSALPGTSKNRPR